MAFGFRAVNDDHVVQIDERFPVMQLVETGTVLADVDVLFVRVLTSTQQPWLFIRGAQVGGYIMGVKFLGGPGQWTGFRLHAVSDLYHSHGLAGRSFGSWQYMVGEWAVRRSADRWGMRVWDGKAELLYDAGVQYINMRFQFQRWRYSHREKSGGWVFVVHYLDLSAEASLSGSDRYLLINPLARERFNLPSYQSTTMRKVGGLQSNRLEHISRTSWEGVDDFIQPGIIGSPSA